MPSALDNQQGSTAVPARGQESNVGWWVVPCADNRKEKGPSMRSMKDATKGTHDVALPGGGFA